MNPDEVAPPDPPRPSMRAVAAAAGVSAMSVSRVLRNHPSVTASMRAHVQKIAREFGYRPDPQVAKLMHHLRVRRKPAFQSSICALTTLLPQMPFHDYSRAILRGARRQAEARGYGFSTLRIGDTPGVARSVQRVLRSRGVEGLLVLPLAVPAGLADWLDWREFSVVSTTSSLLAPELNCVMPHHFKNTQLICRQLAGRGYRRIGLVLSREHVERVNHAPSAALTWYGMFHDGAFVPPLIYRGGEPAQLAAWFKRERPDVIVTHSEQFCRTLAEMLRLKTPGPVGFVSANTTADSGWAGVDELPAEIGATAVDLLTGMIVRGEKGVPAVANVTLLPGHWLDGTSCPPRRGGRAMEPQGAPLLYLEK